MNHAPIAKISGPTAGREGGVAIYSAKDSRDPDGGPLHYLWDFGLGDSSPWDTLVEQGRVYPDNGAYTIRLIVTGNSGARDTAFTTLTVSNVPPRIEAIIVPAQQAVGIPASARVAYSDSGSLDTHTTIISWGDGTIDSVARKVVDRADSMVHTYAKPGSYPVRATVRDKDGASASADAPDSAQVFDATERRTIAGYDVLDLGTLGGNSANPTDVNDYGQIVGSSLTVSGATHAFLWENGAMRDLGTLGHTSSQAQKINNAGLIAGSVWSGSNEDHTPNMRATTWRNGTGQVLDSAGRGPTGAVTMNESGDIVWRESGHEDPWSWLWRRGSWQRLGAVIHPLGHSYTAAMNENTQIVGASDAVHTGESPRPTHHASWWQDSTVRDLGLLAFEPCPSYPDRNCGWSSATSINEKGQVAGFSTAADGSMHAVLWENGTTRDLWTAPASDYSDGRAVINDVGQVAGSAKGEGFFWTEGTLHPLGSLGGGGTAVADMNERGAVVGTSMTGAGQQHVFIWTAARGMVDLGTGPHGFNTAWVIGISYYGDIVGFTARCQPPQAQSCYYAAQGRAVLWRHTQSAASH